MAAFNFCNMNYIQISIGANEEQQEILISELSDLGAIGFEQTDAGLLAYFEENNFRSYEVNQFLQHSEFTITAIPKQNWNEMWEHNFQPVIVNDFCAIRADFHEPIQNVQHEIIITPKMSFGTGHHATTYMMIEQMREIDFTNKTVFDFGTGTGILAILAGKLGAATITAIDIDEWSIENARENFAINNVDNIQLYQLSVPPKNKFDIVLANINRNVLLQYVSDLVTILAPSGNLLLSGLLKEDEASIVDAFNILELKNLREKDNWISLFFVK